MCAQAETVCFGLLFIPPRHSYTKNEERRNSTDMKFNVKVRKLIENGKPLKATCSVTMDDQFTIHGVKVITTEKHTFIAMPSESYTDADGNEKFRDVCHPITSALRKEMEDAVLDAYRAAVLEGNLKASDNN